jgi:hypothetical protein
MGGDVVVLTCTPDIPLTRMIAPPPGSGVAAAAGGRRVLLDCCGNVRDRTGDVTGKISAATDDEIFDFIDNELGTS